MSLHIYVSHTGQCLLADPNQILSPDALRTWIAEEAGIPTFRQILMTARGKNVKQQHLLTEAEVFVYDRQLTSDTSDHPSTFNRSKPSLRRLRDPPSTITNENSLQSWQELFMARRTWALEATEIVQHGTDSVLVHNDEVEIIARSTAVALENLKNHIGSLQHKFETTQKWANEALEEHRAALNDWKTSLNLLSEVPVRRDLTSILLKHGSTLHDLADENLQDAANDLSAASKDFDTALQQLEDSMYTLLEDSANVQKKYGQSLHVADRSTAKSLLEETETLAKRINSDYEDVLQYQNLPKSVATASRRALVHTRDLLPELQTLVDEIHQLLTSSVGQRNEMSETCIETLRAVSSLETRLAGLQAQVSQLDLDQKGSDGLDAINRVFQLPVAYGSLLVEAIRRTDWSKKNEFQPLNLTGKAWPEVSKDELQAYIGSLRALGIDDAVQQITIMLRTVESKAERKRPHQAFKNGSVYDLQQSTIGPTSEDMKILQDDKTRLEDKLKASDSRVRKLEDLLHRQNHLARPASSTFGGIPDLDRPSLSPTTTSARPNDVLSRNSSTASRRLSNQTPDEKALVQRIISLEAELLKLQKEAHAERRSSTESRDKMHEAESIKRDLMANFESQKQEFDEERQLLDEENQKLKLRIEEMEEDFDKMAGSRDNETQKLKIRIEEVEEELDRIAGSRQLLDEEKQKLKARIEEAETEIGRMAGSRQVLDGEKQKLNTRIAEIIAEVESSNTSKRLLKEENDKQKLRIEEMEQEIARVAGSRDHERSTTSQAVGDLQSQLDQLRKILDARGERAGKLSQLLFQHKDRMIRMLEQLGYAVSGPDDQDHLMIQRASKVNASTTLPGIAITDVSTVMRRTISGAVPIQHFSDASDPQTLHWIDTDADKEETKYSQFVSSLSRLDTDAAIDTITKRYKDVENMAKKYQKDSRAYREKSHRLQSEAHEKIAYRSFKEGDLALFLPTRNQATKPWAAFNVGAPHYFLREQDVHKLPNRDWLLARINRVEERVVDLSRSLGSNRMQHDRSSINTEASDGASTRSVDDENPFELSDGLRWYMIDASEEKPGAPSTPGLGKSTVAASNVEVKGSMGKKAEKSGSTAENTAAMVAKTLNKSLDSRRSSSGSKKGHTPSPSLSSMPLPSAVKPSDADMRLGETAREDAAVFEVVRKDLLLGP